MLRLAPDQWTERNSTKRNKLGSRRKPVDVGLEEVETGKHLVVQNGMEGANQDAAHAKL